MKIISRLYNKTVLAATLAFGILSSSCTDYLTIIPSDVVVEEEFWQSKDQVYGVLATSYLKLLSRDAVTKAIIWGELRSETMMYPSGYNPEIKNIIEANIADDNSFCNWSIFYEAINYANLVLECAGNVIGRDPEFLESELRVVKGEMYAMRALCHFYLVRTFRDIPLAMKSAKNDAEIPEYVQVHPLVALDSIMSDLNRAEHMVLNSGAFSSPEDNYGRITKNAVLAMKADVNLWRAAFAKYYDAGNVNEYYDECLQNCRDVIANMDAELKNKNLKNLGPMNLIKNDPVVGKKDNKSTAYDEIFGRKNSSESIFELQVERDNITNGRFNGACNVYGTQGKHGMVIVQQNFLKDNYCYLNGNKTIVNDYRIFSYTNVKRNDLEENTASKTDICAVKYASKESPASGYRASDNWDANWIVYRRTDVLLMMAEAMVARSTAKNSDIIEAFNIVKTIRERSIIEDTKVVGEGKLDINDYISATEPKSIEDLIRKERLLELAYEGKRWYDLVRKALTDKSTDNILFVADRLGGIAPVVKIKMKEIDALFMPIHIDELRYNDNLKQNPAYDKEDSSIDMN